MRIWASLIALSAVILPPSLGNAAVVNWRFEITTDDGDDLVEPGESAHIRVLADLSPSVGEHDDTLDAKIVGYGLSNFDLQADGAWSDGRVADWNVNPYLMFLTGDTSYLDEVDQSIRNVSCWQSLSAEFFDTSDPIFLMNINWSPQGDYSPRSAGVTGQAFASGSREDQEALIYARRTGQTFDDGFVVPFSDASFSFRIVPAPGACAALIVAAGLTRRRPRSVIGSVSS